MARGCTSRFIWRESETSGVKIGDRGWSRGQPSYSRDETAAQRRTPSINECSLTNKRFDKTPETGRIKINGDP